MNSTFKTISIVFSVIILVFFIIFTFFIGNNDETSSFKNNSNLETGLFLLDKKNSSLEKEELNKIIKEKINFLDTIYSINYDKFYKKNLEKKLIEIYNGIFLFDFKDINNSYIVKDDFYSVKSLGSGKFFINNINPRNIIIYNLDNVLEIKFFDSGKIGKTITIFPHTFLAFNKNQILNKTFFAGDFYRMRDFIVFKYLKTSYFKKDNKNLVINKNFFEKLKDFSLEVFVRQNKDYFIKQNNFLEKIFSDILLQEKENKEIIKKLENVKIGNIFERNSLIDYKIFLFNKNKIEVYEKNEILRNINKLFFAGTKDLKKLENKILQDLDDLKKLDKSGYDTMTQIIKSYYSFLIKSNKIGNIENQKIFFDLIMKFDNKKIEENKLLLKQNFEELNSIYGAKDYFKINKNDFLKDFYKFSKKFLSLNENNIEIKKYYSIFLFEFLKNNLNFDDDFDIETYIDLLKIFTEVKNNSIKSKAQLEEYVDFLKNIKAILEANFFDGRDKNSKLIFKNKKLDITKAESLERVIDVLSDYVKNNKDLLNEDEQKDKEILNIFEKNYEILTEFIKALKDPLDYENNYENNFISILQKTKNTKTKLTLKKCREFFIKNFEGLDLSEFKCGIKNNKYTVKNLKISSNKVLNFTLDPNSGNFISDIIIKEDGNTKELGFSYSLDDIKETYTTKIKHYNSSKDRDKYNFKKFFQNTFNNIKKKQEVKNNEQKQSDNEAESSIVIKLKRTRLLGTDGELTYFKNKIFKDISYNQVKVKYKSGEFDIFLDKIPVFYKTKNGLINGLLSANYILNGEKPYFKNIEIIFIGNSRKGDNALGENKLKIVGKIYYNDFEKQIKNIFSQFNIIKYVDSKVKSILKFKKIIIKYNFITKSLEFYINKRQKAEKNIDSLDKMITIIIKDSKIKSLKNVYDELVKKDEKLDYKQIDSFLEALTSSEIY